MNVRALRWLLVPLVVVPLVLLLLHGFGRDPQAIPSRLIGKPMPEFRLVTLDGRTVTSAELRGKPVLLNFWASWCIPACVDEHAVMLEAARSYGSAVQIVGVLYQDTPDGARTFGARYGEPSWPTLLDPDGRLALDFGVTGPPESYFVDARGIVRYKQFGPLTAAVVSDQLGRLLGAAGGRGS
ncbi:MAG: DsbE family thiol:disulfide interchange protein [Chloroflexi bacterium]|nr:MAG: DsbE family thiol:disulfide interchange protein [Chloroflexota bacterium]